MAKLSPPHPMSSVRWITEKKGVLMCMRSVGSDFLLETASGKSVQASSASAFPFPDTIKPFFFFWFHLMMGCKFKKKREKYSFCFTTVNSALENVVIVSSCNFCNSFWKDHSGLQWSLSNLSEWGSDITKEKKWLYQGVTAAVLSQG